MTSMNNPKLADRLIDLEIRLTHQEDTIATLNEAVIQQQQQIDKLSHELHLARRRLNELDLTPGMNPQVEPPPPHY